MLNILVVIVKKQTTKKRHMYFISSLQRSDLYFSQSGYCRHTATSLNQGQGIQQAWLLHLFMLHKQIHANLNELKQRH